MKPGDLVQFAADDETWNDDIAGRLGLVTAVHQALDSKRYKFIFDAIVDGKLKLGIGYRHYWGWWIQPCKGDQ
jgi:hypothetical protein